MEKQLGRKAGTKNKTWCKVPIELYRRKKSELSKEEFEQWWLKKTGRPVDIRYPVKKEGSQWSVIHKLQKQVDEYAKSVNLLEKLLSEKNFYLHQLENRSWIQRLFNLKP